MTNGHPLCAPPIDATRRRLVQAAALSSLGLAGTARAAAYPSKPITLIVPFPTGASFDGVMRPLADAAAQDLGQPVLLINKPGAGGVTGTASLATMQADGYTLAVMHNTMLRQPYMTKVSWDPLRDFTYIAGLAGLVVGIVVAPDAPWQTLDELLADARKRPGEITWGNAGATSVMRIYAERLARAAGVKFNYVPFKGGAESFNALIGRHLDVYGDPGFGAMAKAGKVRLLATFTEQRAPRWPQVPTVKELGHDLVIKTNIGIVAPRGLDPAIASRLEAALLKATKNADYQRMMDEFDFVPWEVSGAAYRSYAEAQFPREKQMLDEIGFKPE